MDLKKSCIMIVFLFQWCHPYDSYDHQFCGMPSPYADLWLLLTQGSGSIFDVSSSQRHSLCSISICGSFQVTFGFHQDRLKTSLNLGTLIFCKWDCCYACIYHCLNIFGDSKWIWNFSLYRRCFFSLMFPFCVVELLHPATKEGAASIRFSLAHELRIAKRKLIIDHVDHRLSYIFFCPLPDRYA